MDQPDTEWQQLERKASFGRDVVETVSAFCNTDGGVIEVGVHDDGSPTGALTIGGRTLEGWANQIKRETDTGQTPSILEAEREGHTIVTIRIAESPIKPVLAYGTAYKRVGRTNQRMGFGEIQRLVEQSTGGSWDGRPCPDSSLEDITPGEKTIPRRAQYIGQIEVTPTLAHIIKRRAGDTSKITAIGPIDEQSLHQGSTWLPKY